MIQRRERGASSHSRWSVDGWLGYQLIWRMQKKKADLGDRDMIAIVLFVWPFCISCSTLMQ